MDVLGLSVFSDLSQVEKRVLLQGLSQYVALKLFFSIFHLYKCLQLLSYLKLLLEKKGLHTGFQSFGKNREAVGAHKKMIEKAYLSVEI